MFNPTASGLQAAHVGVHPVVIAVPGACSGVSERIRVFYSTGNEGFPAACCGVLQ